MDLNTDRLEILLQILYSISLTSGGWTDGAVFTYYRNVELVGEYLGNVTASAASECLLSDNVRCSAYTYQMNSSTCELFQELSGGCQGQVYTIGEGKQVFKIPPPPPPPEVHVTFEDSTQYTLHNGAQLVSETIPFGTSMAVQTDHTQSQYVDLGLLPEACITVPETCACGGTVSVWMKLVACPWSGGVIGSYYTPNTASFVLICNGGNSFSYSVLNGPDEIYSTVSFTFNQWFHAVLIYHGPQDGISVYHDTTKVGTSVKYGRTSTPGTGQTLIEARDVLASPAYYTSVAVDEMKMWNRQISEDEINNMYP